MMMKIFMI